MTLATATPDGRPSARVVLLRGLDKHGLTFFTNRTSRKGEDLRRNPRAAVAIHWWELGRQVRAQAHRHRAVGGGVDRVLDDAPATKPARRLGVAPVAAARESIRARHARRRRRGAIRRRRGSAAAVLGRLPPRSRDRSSSGSTATTGSTTASATPATGPTGVASGWRPSYDGGERAPSVYRPSAFHSM